MNKYNKQKYLINENIPASMQNKFAENRCVLAGGAIRSVFAREPINDIDIYFKNSLFAANLIKFLDEKNYLGRIFETSNAITYKNENGPNIQLIIHPLMMLDDVHDLINSFDYTICMGAYDFSEDEFILHDRFLEHLARKELYYNIKARYPIASLFRLHKFLKRGYTISGIEIIKLGLSINNINISDNRKLSEHINGIDVSILQDLCNCLNNTEEYNFEKFIDFIDQYTSEKLDDFLE